jgi:hypothetical protein
MAKKRQDGKGPASRKMARIVVAEKGENGHYSFNQKMVPLEDVEDELEAAKNDR